MRLAWALTIAACAWIALLAFAAVRPAGAEWACDLLARFCSYICHQQPERTFEWSGAPWPVCARCLGLYALAPAGAAIAIAARGPVVFAGGARNLAILAIAGAPTAVTWLLEHAMGAPMSNGVRFAAALPLGAAVAWVLVRTARNPA